MVAQNIRTKESKMELWMAWITDLANYSSLHAVGWFLRIEGPYLKMMVMVGSLAIITCLPILVGYQMVSFTLDMKVFNAVEWKKESTLPYPNVTVCHPKFFDKRKLGQYNISDDLATYMTLALDPTSQMFYNFSITNFGDPDRMKAGFQAHEDTLEAILSENSMDLLELFKAVAIECDGFIFYCEVHRKFLLNKDMALGRNVNLCCGSLFNPEPTFGPSGACFTTHVPIIETYPSVLNSLRIWTYGDSVNTPEMNMMWKGSEAAERSGYIWTVSDQDNPAVQMNQVLHRSRAGSVTTVGLRRIETDRSESSRNCLRANQTFLDQSGYNLTRLNCEGFNAHFRFGNCSVALYFGYKPLAGLSPCKPKDLIHTQENIMMNFASECPDDCRTVSHSVSSSTSRLDLKAVDQFMNGEMMKDVYGKAIFPHPEDCSVLQIFFESFDYPLNVISQEGYLDILSKIGGTMGLLIGASMVSLVEVMYFLGYLLRIIVCDFLSLGRYTKSTRGSHQNTIRTK